MNFGTQPRPGGEPPPRQPLTQAEIDYRGSFTRAGHLASNPPPAPEKAEPKPPPITAFDEVAIRAALAQVGMDFTFQIFPIGEKPAEGAGASQRREQRLEELEAERTVMRTRMLAAESAAAGAIQELKTFQAEYVTLQTSMETLQASRSGKKPSGKKPKQEAA